jgi:hypothetical protein
MGVAGGEQQKTEERGSREHPRMMPPAQGRSDLFRARAGSKKSAL